MKLFDLFALMHCQLYVQAWNTVLYKHDFSMTALLNSLSSKHEESKRAITIYLGCCIKKDYKCHTIM